VVYAAGTFVHAESVSPKNDTSVTLSKIINRLEGSGVTIDSPVYTGESNAQIGVFSGFNFLFGKDIGNGVVISTGRVADVVVASNTDDGSSGDTLFNGTVNNSDPLFQNA